MGAYFLDFPLNRLKKGLGPTGRSEKEESISRVSPLGWLEKGAFLCLYPLGLSLKSSGLSGLFFIHACHTAFYIALGQVVAQQQWVDGSFLFTIYLWHTGFFISDSDR